MRLLVCGGRLYKDKDKLRDTLKELHLDTLQTVELCHGGAKGADTLAGELALELGLPCTVFPADWDRYGKSAGTIRNRQMLVEFKPDLVVACPGGAGTQNMINQALKNNINVIYVKKASNG